MTKNTSEQLGGDNQADSLDNHEQLSNYGIKLMAWQVPQYEKQAKPRGWFFIAGLVFIGLILLSIFTPNFLFGTPNYFFVFILVISAVLLIINERQEEKMMDFIITSEGLVLGHRFYDYDKIRQFAVFYKPMRKIKRLYVEFNNPLNHRWSLPLYDNNPVEVRQLLLRYLPEEVDRVNETLGDRLVRWLKL